MKMRKIGNVAILTIVFMVMMTTECFADMYIDPVELAEYVFPGFSFIVTLMLAFAVEIFLALFCIVIGKIVQSEELVSRAKIIAESLCFYFLYISNIVISYNCFEKREKVAIVGVIILLIALYYRIGMKKKLNAYMLMVGYSIFLIYVPCSDFWF